MLGRVGTPLLPGAFLALSVYANAHPEASANSHTPIRPYAAHQGGPRPHVRLPGNPTVPPPLLEPSLQLPVARKLLPIKRPLLDDGREEPGVYRIRKLVDVVIRAVGSRRPRPSSPPPTARRPPAGVGVRPSIALLYLAADAFEGRREAFGQRAFSYGGLVFYLGLCGALSEGEVNHDLASALAVVRDRQPPLVVLRRGTRGGA